MLSTRPAAAWEDELNAIGVPAGAVMGLPQVLAHPHLAGRGFLAHFDEVPGAGRGIDVATTGVHLDGAPLTVDRPPPELGQDNAAVWGALGLDPDEIEALARAGVI